MVLIKILDRGKGEALSDVGGSLRKEKKIIDRIIQGCYGAENRHSAFERACFDSKKMDPSNTNTDRRQKV